MFFTSFNALNTVLTCKHASLQRTSKIHYLSGDSGVCLNMKEHQNVWNMTKKDKEFQNVKTISHVQGMRHVVSA